MTQLETKTSSNFSAFTFLLGQSIISDHPPPAPISLFFLNKVGSLIAELLLSGRNVVSALFFPTSFSVVALGSETLEVSSMPRGTASSHQLRPTLYKQALSPWDSCPNTTCQWILGKTLPLSKLYLKGLRDTEKIITEKSREGGCSGHKFSYSYNILIASWRTRNCWFSSLLSSIQCGDFNFGLFQHSSSAQRWLRGPTDNQHSLLCIASPAEAVNGVWYLTGEWWK